MDFVGAFDQRNQIGIGVDNVGESCCIDESVSIARQDIGMRLVYDEGVGPKSTNLLQQHLGRVDCPGTEADGCVVGHLTWHEDDSFVAWNLPRRCTAAKVVLREAEFRDEGA
ncbi:hypothetical protein WI25_24840 [Burkholderia cepacia]|nr:hypothetical protein WI25_24840 [Burkholderia cepacia]KWB25486.1 hypothetical protein WL32_05505 [Burkholderia cepacia]